MIKLNHCMVVHLVSQTPALSKPFFFVHLKINNQKCLTRVSFVCLCRFQGRVACSKGWAPVCWRPGEGMDDDFWGRHQQQSRVGKSCWCQWGGGASKLGAALQRPTECNGDQTTRYCWVCFWVLFCFVLFFSTVWISNQALFLFIIKLLEDQLITYKFC